MLWAVRAHVQARQQAPFNPANDPQATLILAYEVQGFISGSISHTQRLPFGGDLDLVSCHNTNSL